MGIQEELIVDSANKALGDGGQEPSRSQRLEPGVSLPPAWIPSQKGSGPCRSPASRGPWGILKENRFWLGVQSRHQFYLSLYWVILLRIHMLWRVGSQGGKNSQKYVLKRSGSHGTPSTQHCWPLWSGEDPKGQRNNEGRPCPFHHPTPEQLSHKKGFSTRSDSQFTGS